MHTHTNTHTHFSCICQCGTQAEKMLTQCVVGGKRDNGAVGPSVQGRENTHQSYYHQCDPIGFYDDKPSMHCLQLCDCIDEELKKTAVCDYSQRTVNMLDRHVDVATCSFRSAHQKALWVWHEKLSNVRFSPGKTVILLSVKGIVYSKMKVQPLSSHPHADGRSGEVF